MKNALRRMLAGVMLVTVVASLAAPLHASAGAACPENASSAGAPVLAAAMDHGGCEHLGTGPCLATLGCLNAPPALGPPGAALHTDLTIILARPAAAPRYTDLYRTGPPTPPPNSI